MTIIEKLYQGEILSEKELECLVFGYSFHGCDELGDIIFLKKKSKERIIAGQEI